jgi:hypothetical protein
MLLLLNAISFENGFSTATELEYSVFDEESYACKRELHKKVVFSEPVVVADFVLASKLWLVFF